MIVQTVPSQRFVPARLPRAFVIATGLLVFLGFVQAESAYQSAAYLIVVFASVLPSILWLKMGARGIPILPAVGLAYIPYYASPILGSAETTVAYTEWEIVLAGITVALFLIAATIAWRLVTDRVRVQQGARRDHRDRRVLRLIAGGILMGILFHLSLASGWLTWLGSFFGLARSILITFATVACFLTGVARAWGILRGRSCVLAILGVATLIMLTWSSLFLAGGLIYLLAVGFGYAAVARRIPWSSVAAIFVIVAILHAGKGEMRAKYWAHGINYGQALSLGELPAFAAEWFGEGIKAIVGGYAEGGLLNRASLLHMVLRVQRLTPNTVDYLKGETYAMLPSTLVPRFISADKPASQVGMDLLNIRYSVLTVEGAATTAVGWGLVAEAYANFGYLGVIGLGLAFGALCAALGNWSVREQLLSIPSLVSIATLIALVNLEADFVSLCSTLFQQAASVLIVYAAYRWLAIRESVHSPAGTREPTGARAVA